MIIDEFGKLSKPELALRAKELEIFPTVEEVFMSLIIKKKIFFSFCSMYGISQRSIVILMGKRLKLIDWQKVACTIEITTTNQQAMSDQKRHLGILVLLMKTHSLKKLF